MCVCRRVGSLFLSFFPAQSIVIGVEIAVDLVTDRRIQSPVVGHRGAGHARSLLVPLEDPGGSAGPLYQRWILLLRQNVTRRLVARRGCNNSGGRDIVAGLSLTGHRVQMMTGQVRHRRSERHIGMVLRMMVVGLRAVVHVRDLGLIVVAAGVRRLSVGVVTLAGVLAMVHGGPRRAPGETICFAVMDLVHRGWVGRRLQLVGARRQRWRRGRQVAVGSAAAGRCRADSRIRRLR